MEPNRTDLSRFDNSWYQPGGAIKRMVWLLTQAFFFQSWFPWPSSLKASLLRTFGANVGKGVVIKPSVRIKYPWFLEIGDYSWIGESVWIDNLAEVKIGANCCISQGAMLLTGNHNYKKKNFDLFVGKITLKNGCWIGAQTLVSPGITCGEESILSAGAVVHSDMDAYGIYQGNPAEKVKTRKIDG